MLYDTHTHPYLSQLKAQKEILKRFFSVENRYLNSIWVDINTSLQSISLSKQYPWVFASIGIHPTSTQEYIGKNEETIQQLKYIYQENREYVIAIGECWLDYHWLESLSQKYTIPVQTLKEVQKTFFITQIQLAKKLNLPIIIHNRDAKEDVFEILQQEDCKNFVFHCYSEDIIFAKKIIDFSPHCKLWFWGVVTFKSAILVQETAQKIPLKNIIIETDAPYLTPIPYRGKEENEPLYTQYVLEKIIELRDESPEEITRTIFANSESFFIKK